MQRFCRPGVWTAFCWTMLVLSATGLWAADAKPVKVVRVTVAKLDGTTVNGELIESSPAGVTVKPSPKADKLLVAWAQIRRVSNGLTRQKVVDDWRITHADLLCDTCHGDGTVKCDVCNGTGVDPAHAVACDKCKCSGYLGKCPKCTDGKVPCPNTCLKASMFAGLAVQSDGKKHKTFHNRDGSSQWWSEAHVGDLIVQENGQWVDKGKCPTCGGTGEVVCPTCHGTAKTECPVCHGGGVTGPACTNCQAGRVVCKTCDGSGLNR